MAYEVEIVERQPEVAAVVVGRVPHEGVGPFIGAALGEVLGVVGETSVTGMPFCRIDMDGDEFLLEVGFPVAEPVEPTGRVVPSRLPGGETATVMNVGPYDAVPPAYFAIEQWLSDNGFSAAGRPWEAYLDGPDVPLPRTLVCWPFSRAEGDA
jgi:effector-binding domain-containing protein